VTVNRPKISVCLPSYNQARYLSKAIESVLAQKYRDYELIIVDDASDDGSFEIIERYASEDKRITCMRNEQNVGMVRNWNICLEMAHGEYIKFLFGDDYFNSDLILGWMANRLDRDPFVSIVASARNYVDESSDPLKVMSHFGDNADIDGKDVIKLCFFSIQNLIGEPTAVMFRKEQATRGFDEKYKQLVDLELWFHLLEQGRFVYIDRPLCSFRVHPGQQTAENVRREVEIEDTIYLLQEYLEKSYLKIPGYVKSYLVYDYYYGKWKTFQKGRTDFQTSISMIRPYGLGKFFAILPVYKLIKPFVNLFKSLAKRRLKENGVDLTRRSNVKQFTDKETSKPSDYYSTREEMLPFIPDGARKILDLGCGEGGFGGLLKEERGVEVWGVEKDEVVAETASRVLDKVIVADVERNSIDLPQNYFDCIVFNDVLEHFVDPWAILKIIGCHLVDKGFIVASIPNVRYWDNLWNLLVRKSWRYTDQGILDITHLRFFTKKSIADLFQSCGYEIVEITGIGKKRSKRFLIGFLNALTLRALDDTKYLQFACVVKKNPSSS